MTRVLTAVAVACLVLSSFQLHPSAQGGLPNPYRPVKGLADGGGMMVPGGDWARLPGGREMGPPASMHVDIDGESIWAFIRCDETNPVTLANGGRFGIDCLDAQGRIKNIDTVYKFDAKGTVVTQLRRRHVHLAARAARGSRRQRVGNRRRES